MNALKERYVHPSPEVHLGKLRSISFAMPCNTLWVLLRSIAWLRARIES